MSDALVSCLMVTADRPHFVAQAISNFAQQSYPHRELVIIDDGFYDLSDIIAQSAAATQIRYVKVARTPRKSLGDLRNMSLDAAQGEWCLQWDDDEWYHPHRIERQMVAVSVSGKGSCALKWTLMSIAKEDPREHIIFRADTGVATPGTILFRRDTKARYRGLARNEDGFFMRDVRHEMGLEVMGQDFSHLFIRVYHGINTWDLGHFMKRLYRRPIDWPSYFHARYVRGDITQHRAFSLTIAEQDAAEMYRQSSRNVVSGVVQ